MRKTRVKLCRVVALDYWERIGRKMPYKRIIRQVKKLTPGKIAKELQACSFRPTFTVNQPGGKVRI
jgi:hypothetical protein